MLKVGYLQSFQVRRNNHRQAERKEIRLKKCYFHAKQKQKKILINQKSLNI